MRCRTSLYVLLRLLVLLAVVALGGSLFAEPVTEEAARLAASHWVTRSVVFRQAATRLPPGTTFTIRTVVAVTLDRAQAVPYFAVELDPVGYVIVNGDDRLTPVLAFSADSALVLTSSPRNTFRVLLERNARATAQVLGTLDAGSPMRDPLHDFAIASQAQWQALTAETDPDRAPPDTPGSTLLRDVMLTTLWDQGRHYNRLCPVVPDGMPGYDDRAPTGCVATGGGQIMKSFNWPPYGHGSYTYNDPPNPALSGQRSATFTGAYNWPAMKAFYDWNADEPADAVTAVATLLCHVGFAVNMDYEKDWSLSLMSSLASGLGEHFFYEQGQYKDRPPADPTTFDATLRQQMIDGIPTLTGIPYHAVVFDGLSVESNVDYYHANYGWGGDTNGWYALTAMPPAYAGGDTGSVDSAVFGIKPALMPIFSSIAPITTSAGSVTVNWLFPPFRLNEVRNLAIREARLFQQDFVDSADSFTSWTNPGAKWVVTAASGRAPAGNWFHKAAEQGSFPLTFDGLIIPGASAALTFDYDADLFSDRFVVQLSTDGGGTWTDVLTIGTQATGQESVNLSGYQGQELGVRFLYRFQSGSYRGGISIDNVAITGAQVPQWTILSNTLAKTATSYARTYPGDGDYYHSLQAQHDSDGQWGLPSPLLRVTVTGAVPAATFLINDNATYTTSRDVTLSFTNVVGAPTQMRFSDDGGTNWHDWELFAATKGYTLPDNGNGSYTVTAQIKNSGGTASANLGDSILLDATLPTGSLTINGGAAATKNAAVILMPVGNDANGVTHLRFRNATDADWPATWDAYSPDAKNWNLPAGDGSKTVQVQFKDAAGNESLPIGATIFLDTVAPVGTLSINGGAATCNNRSVTLTPGATDTGGSGVAQMRFSNTGTDGWSTWTGYTTAGVAWNLAVGADGNRTVYAEYRDNAGNVSAVVNDAIVLDTTLPTGTISIDSGADDTTSTGVTLNLTAADGAGTGVTHMQFSNDNVTWSGWEGSAITKDWTLNPPDGTKTVYVRFRDAAGNSSLVYSDSILLDAAAPTVQLTVACPADPTAVVPVTVTFNKDGITGFDISDVRTLNSMVENFQTLQTGRSYSFDLSHPPDSTFLAWVEAGAAKDSQNRDSVASNDVAVIPLGNGWNLVSFPVIPASANSADIRVNAANASKVFLTYLWLLKANALGTTHYETTPLLNGGQAYWLHTTAQILIGVEGARALGVYALTAGWNGVGPLMNADGSVRQQAHGYGWLFDAANQRYTIVPANADLDPGVGYFLRP